MSGIGTLDVSIGPETCRSEGESPVSDDPEPLIVLKFGGTSVGTPARIRRAAKRVQRHLNAGARVLVVVSATGGTTDRIARWLHAVAPGGCEEAAREFDRALATGEDLAAAMLAAALLSLGLRAVSLRGPEAGLEANGPYGAGEIQHIRGDRLQSLLDRGVVPVVAGFQASGNGTETVTLGRGGSDTTATYLAGVLGASACHIVTDVEGVYDRDPSKDPSARQISCLDHEALVSLVESGAQVVHPAAARHALRFGTPLHVYGFRAPPATLTGTCVFPRARPLVSGASGNGGGSAAATPPVPTPEDGS